MRGGAVVDEAEDEGGGFVGEGFDVVGFEDDLGGFVAGGFGGDLGCGGEPVGGCDGGGGGVDGGEEFGGAEGVVLEEAVGGGDLDGGGVLAAEEDGLLGAAGEVAEFGVLDGGEFGGCLGEYGRGEVRGVEVVQGASDAVRGFEQVAVGDHHGAAAGQVRLGDRVHHLGEVLAFLLAAPAFGVGFQGVGGAGGVGVGAPGGVGEQGEGARQGQERARVRAAGRASMRVARSPSPVPQVAISSRR
ncbi:hypothetical protein [Kitasatospora purpeofusca]|uniref:hypothetical protein n=1 Tax=Kitasatospora purpeofusca TaxID=67352 RepID=UPI002A59CD5D|nr:hypothetical protein [Kitasatospora purpeofusca]MDY0811089.1 hypothetical protein [Kitasatospora purpeofusca]